MPIREWVKENVGLLDDDRYVEMSDSELAAWEILYKVQARLPNEVFKDEQQVLFNLRRYGRRNPAAMIKALRAKGWLEECDGGLTIHKWKHYQIVYRGPSDLPEVKAQRNASGPTTDAERRAAAAEREQERKAREAQMRDHGPVVSFKEAIAAAGFDPKKLAATPDPAALDEASGGG